MNIIEGKTMEKTMKVTLDKIQSLQENNKKLLEAFKELLEALKMAEFDLRIRKQMFEELTPMQLSILKKAQQAIKKAK